MENKKTQPGCFRLRFLEQLVGLRLDLLPVLLLQNGEDPWSVDINPPIRFDRG